MDMQTGEEVPPKSTDLAGWRQAIATDRLKLFRLEALVAAFQDLGDRDHRHLHFRIFPCAKMVIMRRRSVFSLLVYREPVTIYRLAVRISTRRVGRASLVFWRQSVVQFRLFNSAELGRYMELPQHYSLQDHGTRILNAI